MRLLYFAQLADALRQTEEQISPPADVIDIESLLGWLRRRGGPRADLTTARLRVTVDRQFAGADTPNQRRERNRTDSKALERPRHGPVRRPERAA